jgi:hypothetical protein
MSNKIHKANFNSWITVACLCKIRVGFHKVTLNYNLAWSSYQLQEISNLEVLYCSDHAEIVTLKKSEYHFKPILLVTCREKRRWIWGSHSSDYEENIFWNVPLCSLLEVRWHLRAAHCFHLFLLRIFLYLKIEAMRSSETSVNFYHTAQHRIPENSIHLGKNYVLTC